MLSIHPMLATLLFYQIRVRGSTVANTLVPVWYRYTVYLNVNVSMIVTTWMTQYVVKIGTHILANVLL